MQSIIYENSCALKYVFIVSHMCVCVCDTKSYPSFYAKEYLKTGREYYSIIEITSIKVDRGQSK